VGGEKDIEQKKELNKLAEENIIQKKLKGNLSLGDRCVTPIPETPLIYKYLIFGNTFIVTQSKKYFKKIYIL